MIVLNKIIINITTLNFKSKKKDTTKKISKIVSFKAISQ